jgi:hypothetical protein
VPDTNVNVVFSPDTNVTHWIKLHAPYNLSLSLVDCSEWTTCPHEMYIQHYIIKIISYLRICTF